MSITNERFFAVELMNDLHQIFQHTNPDKMFIIGRENEIFSSITRGIIPFLQLVLVTRIFRNDKKSFRKWSES